MKKRRDRGVNLRSRLLCPVCREVKPVKKIEELITLLCGHSRPECLPTAPGHISLEHLRTKVGQKLFPAPTDKPQVIKPQSNSETETPDDDISVLPVLGTDAVTVCMDAFKEFSDDGISNRH
jgi:hypothetical protein